MFYNEKNRLIAVLPANIKTASPPALSRREGAGVLNGERDKTLEERLVSESAPSLRGKSDVDNIGVCVRGGGRGRLFFTEPLIQVEQLTAL